MKAYQTIIKEMTPGQDMNIVATDMTLKAVCEVCGVHDFGEYQVNGHNGLIYIKRTR